MRRLVTLLLLCLAASALSGCSGIPLNEKSLPKVASVLGIKPDQIVDWRRCVAGYARLSDEEANIIDCLAISTNEWVALVGYDSERKTYKPLAVLDLRVHGVALASNGLFEQIQASTGDGHIILDVRDSRGIGFGQGDELHEMLERLKGLGIPEVPARSYVGPKLTGPQVIYLYY